MVVVFPLIGLVDAIFGESLATIGSDIFLIQASAWIVANIGLLVILFRPERRQSRALALRTMRFAGVHRQRSAANMSPIPSCFGLKDSLRRPWRRLLSQGLDRQPISESAIIMLTALVVGVGSGLGAVVFAADECLSEAPKPLTGEASRVER